MLKKRAAILLLIFSGLTLCLILRLMYLQLFAGDSLAKSASAQRIISSSVEKPRGNILDRNEISFTNREKKYTIVLKPVYLKDNESGLSEICDIVGLDYDTIKNELQTRQQPVLFETDEKNKDALMALKVEGVSVIYSMERYASSSIARHVLGYLNKKDQVGQNGIEKFYEDALKETGKSSIGVVTDARNDPLMGLGYRINKEAGDSGMLDVKLTLDYHIQKIVEDVMVRNGVTGAVVVENVNTGDIVAMASKPDFDQNSVENYLNSAGNELYNRAVASYNIGSIFKIVDTAAFLESPGIIQEEYDCLGSIKIGTNIFKCSSYNEGGHGKVDLTKAFANSCNPYFIEMGIKAGYRNLVGMAEKFGLGSVTGIKVQGIGEAKGNLPPIDGYYSDSEIANLSIGQGVIMATPLQVADIVATIANGGIKNKMNIVDSVIDRRENKVREIKVKEGHRIISRETAEKIKMLMEAVTDYGTGTAARLEQYGGAAGKTGSAETGKKEVVHAWFAGYFPRSQPEYAVSVLVENGQYGGKVAAPIFSEIASEIMKKGF